jgi:hypothetical protein
MMPVQPISTARLASATDMMPFRQNCPFHSFTISATSFQVMEGSSISVKYFAIDTAPPLMSTCWSNCGILKPSCVM